MKRPRSRTFDISRRCRGKNIPISLKVSKNRIVNNLKGFSRDPLFYLGSASIILLISAAFTVKTDNQAYLSMENLVLKSAEVAKKVVVESENFQLESPDLYLIQKNSIFGFNLPTAVSPKVLGVILGETEPEASKTITEYEVKEGDTLTAIAETFGISFNTLLWANDLTKKSTIKPGQKLVILPVSGLLHNVESGDTISAIAKKYKTDIDEIVSINELSSQDDIFIGDILIIPGGIMPVISKPVYAQVPVASSYFIFPISSTFKITQGLHFYNAVDFSHGKCGAYIYASAGGVVQRVKMGWNSGAGNTITILHPNGVVTSYGHILSSLVSPGEKVSQGQAIALMGGNTSTQGVGAGRSTGCHVHFAVHGAKNPFAIYSAGTIIK